MKVTSRGVQPFDQLIVFIIRLRFIGSHHRRSQHDDEQPLDQPVINAITETPGVRWGLKARKKEADERMERSLYQRGLGYSYDAVKIFMPAGAKKPIYAPSARSTRAPSATITTLSRSSCRPEQRSLSTRRTSSTCRRTRPRRSSG
jgi:hypothetical protein